MTSKAFPNLIIAGVNKAGTTSLFTYLSRHPEVCCSSIKETCYFLPLRYNEKISLIEEYAKYFSHYGGQKYIMESTPGYFYGGAKIARYIKKTVGEVKVIIVFRNPVDRLLSFYRSMKSKMQIEKDLSIDEYLQTCESLDISERNERRNNPYFGLDGGFYDENIDHWFDVFGDSIKITFFEDLKENPSAVLKDLGEWLCIDQKAFDLVECGIENKTVYYDSKLLHRIALSINSKGEELLRKHPRVKSILRQLYYAINASEFDEHISEKTIYHLEELYRPHNTRLARQLRKKGYINLPHWLKEERS